MNETLSEQSSHIQYYQSYLVRLWRENPTAEWRVVLRYVPTGDQYHFQTLADCLTYIETRAIQPTDAPPTSPPLHGES